MKAYYNDESVICFDCRCLDHKRSEKFTLVTDREALPDGFTCDECGKVEKWMNEYLVTSVLKIMHTDKVEANSLEEAYAIVDGWVAEDFTEDDDCSRSWDIRID
jgi:hypothetical protein